MKSYKIFFPLCFGIICLLSCGDFLKEFSQDLVYAQSCDDLDEIMIGNAYLKRHQDNSSTGVTDGKFYYPYLHLMDDDSQERYYGKPTGLTLINYLRNIHSWAENPFTATNGTKVKDYAWEKLYNHISTLNVIISYIDEFKDDPEEQRQRLLGESKFLRGAYYYLLVNLYALPYNKNTADSDLGVPLKLTEYIEDKFFTRDPVSTVYKQIVTDLKDAITHFDKIPQSSIYRASQKATYALLSRVYLYMGEWELAIEACDQVIEMGCPLWNLSKFDYSSDIKTRDYFNTLESPEIIFTTGSTAMHALMDDQSGSLGLFSVSEDLLEQYNVYLTEGKEDLRLNCFFTYSHSGDAVVARKTANFVKSSIKATVFDAFILRSAEIYLNKAEAQAMLDNKEAINTIQTLLKNRFAGGNIPDIGGLTGEDLVRFIREERRRELCFESHRWFDLRRYAVAPKYPEKRSISHTVYEMPASTGSGIVIGSYTLKPYGEDNAWVLPLPADDVVFNEGELEDNPERAEREMDN